MSDQPEPMHLNNHHRTTLLKILTHPTSHNIEWPDVLSLLEVAGTVDEGREGKFTVTLGSETETFDRANNKDLDVQTIVDLRRMLRGAGYDTPAP
ncbi:MAG: type II toxin-antitoxin system HicA family toxin [Acidimicrobiales bacterium]